MGATCINISKAFGAASSCKNNMGGVKNLWIAPTSDVSVITPPYPTPFLQASAVDKVTDIDDSAAASSIFFKFPLPIDLGDYVEDVTADPKLGVSFVTITINGTLLGLSHDTSAELSKIMQGQQTLIAELYDGRYVLLGEANGMDLTGGGSRSGAEASSLQGYEVTWTGKEPHYARFVDEAKVVTTTAGQITVVT